MAKRKTLRINPDDITPFDFLYVGSHHYTYAEHPMDPPPGGKAQQAGESAARKDLYQTFLIFAAATAMVDRQKNQNQAYDAKGVKVALVGDAVWALHPNESAHHPHPRRANQATLKQAIDNLPQGVQVYY